LEAALSAADDRDAEERKRRAALAVEAALLGPPEDDRTKNARKSCQIALMAALLDDEEGAKKTEEPAGVDAQLRENAQAALEAALESTDEQEQAELRQNAQAALEAAQKEAELKRNTQAALEAALECTDEQEQAELRQNAQAALEAALEAADEKAQKEAELKQNAQAALEAALEAADKEDDRTKAARKNCQSALMAALLDDTEEEKKEVPPKSEELPKKPPPDMGESVIIEPEEVPPKSEELPKKPPPDMGESVIIEPEDTKADCAPQDDNEDSGAGDPTVVAAMGESLLVDPEAQKSRPPTSESQRKARTSLKKAGQDGSLQQALKNIKERSKAAPGDGDGALVTHMGPKPGDQIEVYSNSLKSWCPGEIDSVMGSDNMVKVTYSDGSMVYSKVIEWGHPNLRPRGATSMVTAYHQKADRQARAEAHRQAEIERRKMHKYKVGDKIEIFSNTQKQWCKGEIVSIDGPPEEGQMCSCAYITGNGTEMSKKIAMGHPNLRFDDTAWSDYESSRPGSSNHASRPGSSQPQSSRPNSSQVKSNPRSRPGSSEAGFREARQQGGLFDMSEEGAMF
jgi:hypothetical protein